MPITYAYQCKGKGLSYAVLQIKPHVDQMFLLYNGDNVFADGVRLVVGAAADADAVLGVENVSLTGTETTSILTDKMERVTGAVEKPADLPSILVAVNLYVLSTDVFHACALLQLSAEDEYHHSEGVNLLMRTGSNVCDGPTWGVCESQ